MSLRRALVNEVCSGTRLKPQPIQLPRRRHPQIACPLSSLPSCTEPSKSHLLGTPNPIFGSTTTPTSTPAVGGALQIYKPRSPHSSQPVDLEHLTTQFRKGFPFKKAGQPTTRPVSVFTANATPSRSSQAVISTNPTSSPTSKLHPTQAAFGLASGGLVEEEIDTKDSDNVLEVEEDAVGDEDEVEDEDAD